MAKYCVYLWMILGLLSTNVYAQKNDLEKQLKQAYTARLKGDYDRNFQLLQEAEDDSTSNPDPLLLAKLYAELSKQYLVFSDYDKAKS